MSLNLILVFLILFFLPLGQLGRLPFNFPMVNIYLSDLFILILIILHLKENGLRVVKNNRIFRFLLPFLAISLLSLVMNISSWGWQNSFLGSLYWLRYLSYFFIFLTVFSFKKVEKKMVLKFLFLSGWALALIGLVQYLVYPDFRSWELFDWDPHLYRVVATFFDPGFLGLIYVEALGLAIFLFWKRIKSFDWKLIMIWLFPIYLSLALTYSRSSYLAWLFLLGVFSWSKKTFKPFLIGAGILILTLVILPQRSSIGNELGRKDSIYSRIENYKHSLIIAQEKSVLGVGFNNYRWVQKEMGYLEEAWQESHSGAGADNSFLFILATTGLLGLGGYLYFLKGVFKMKSPLVLAAFGPWLIHSFFNNSLFYPWLLIWGWVILGSVGDD